MCLHNNRISQTWRCNGVKEYVVCAGRVCWQLSYCVHGESCSMPMVSWLTFFLDGYVYGKNYIIINVYIKIITCRNYTFISHLTYTVFESVLNRYMYNGRISFHICFPIDCWNWVECTLRYGLIMFIYLLNRPS